MIKGDQRQLGSAVAACWTGVVFASGHELQNTDTLPVAHPQHSRTSASPSEQCSKQLPLRHTCMARATSLAPLAWLRSFRWLLFSCSTCSSRATTSAARACGERAGRGSGRCGMCVGVWAGGGGS